VFSSVAANPVYNQHSYYTSFASDHVYYTPFCLHIELSSLPWISVKTSLTFSCYMSSWLTARQTNSIRKSGLYFVCIFREWVLVLDGCPPGPKSITRILSARVPPICEQRCVNKDGLQARRSEHSVVYLEVLFFSEIIKYYIVIFFNIF
jgi:hypothetical protein